MNTNQDSEFHGKYQREVFDTLRQAYGPFWLSISGALLLGFLGRLFLLGNANVIGLWVDSLCKPEASNVCSELPSWLKGFSNENFLALLLVLTVTGFLFTSVFRIWFSIISARAVSTIYDEVTLRTSRYPMSFFDTQPVGRIVTRFSSDYGTVFRLFGGPLAEFISIIYDLILFVVLISLSSSAFIPLLVLIVFTNYYLYFSKRDRLRQLRRSVSRNRSPSIAHFAETTQGASTIRVAGQEPEFSARFKELDQSYLKDKKDLVAELMTFSLQMNLLTALTLLAIGFIALYGIQTQWLSIGDVGASFALIVLSGYTLQMFFDWMTQFEEGMVGVERLDQYLRLPLEKDAILPPHTQFKTGSNHKIASAPNRSSVSVSVSSSYPLPEQISVHFKNIQFRYNSQLPWIFKDLNFDIPAGEHWGVIGKTGSGKSTLTQLLSRLYTPESGELLLGPHSSHSTSLDFWRAHISAISQEPTLFRGTLRENLRTESIEDSVLLKALERVGLYRFLNEKDLDFEIEEKGRNLSAGEKQLISLARTLIRSSPLVILDEATASVDPQTEEIMVKASNEFFKSRTQIIVAHRLSTIEKCDKVLWLDQGQIRMIGTPSEVLKSFQPKGTPLE